MAQPALVGDRLDEAKAAKAARAFGVPHHYTDARTMLEAAAPDFVDVVTTMPTHRALVELAAAQRVPVVVQKPFAPQIADCRAMAGAGAAVGVPLMVHENFRFQTPILAVREVLERGTIGRPFFARISWRTGRVTCRTASVRPGIRGEDCATLLLDHERGLTCIVDATYQAPQDPDPFPETTIEIDGADGTLRLRPGYALEVTTRNGSEHREVAPALLPWASRPWHGIQESVLTTQRHWVDCLRHKIEPETSGADNLRAFALCEAAYASAARAEPVVPEA